MEKSSMCRVCLGQDVRLNSIVGTHLQEMYESLVLMPLETTDSRPVLACYICCARLNNCYELRNGCLQSEELFTQILSSNEPEQVKLQAINNRMRLTMDNVVHLSLGHELEMNADNVGAETLKSEVKLEPNDCEEDLPVLGSQEQGDLMLVDNAVERAVGNSTAPSTDTDEDALEENSVFDNVQSADSGDDFVIIVIEEQTGDMTIDPTPKASTQDDQRNPEDLTSSNLKHHVLVRPVQTYKRTYKLRTLQNVSRENSAHPAQKPHQCNVCHRSFSRIQYLAGHMQTHTVKRQFHCDLCSKRFSSKEILIKHMRKHTNEKPYQCNICNIQYSWEGDMTIHMRTHTGEKPYHCDFCDERFSSNSHLWQHMRTHTGEKPYHCDFCDKRFSSNSNLCQHIRTHTGEKPYHCDFCDKRFSSKSNLCQHIRTHTGEKPYHCDLCDKRYSSNAHLWQHMRTHTGEKPYHCDFCDKRFSLNSNLYQHIRTHTGEKPYHCDFCDKRFSSNSNLCQHIRTHTGEKPHYCDICKKQFSRKSHLNEHMRTHIWRETILL